MKGKDFGDKINEYLKLEGHEVHKVGTGFPFDYKGEIEANPELSKHLDIATMKVFDVWIDLVNLRAEDYAETFDHTKARTSRSIIVN